MGTGVALSTQPPENLSVFKSRSENANFGLLHFDLCNPSISGAQKQRSKIKVQRTNSFGSGGLGSQRAIARTTERPKSALRNFLRSQIRKPEISESNSDEEEGKANLCKR